MKILMLGWELPPHNSGGLGVACLNMARALVDQGADIDFVVPYEAEHSEINFMNILSATRLDPIYRYGGGAYESLRLLEKIIPTSDESRLVSIRDIQRSYCKFVDNYLMDFKPDVIHAHDWLTYEAGVLAKRKYHMPLIAHVHATEFDRAGMHVGNPLIHEIEQESLMLADEIIAVSEATKRIVHEKYHIPLSKIHVVYNSLDSDYDTSKYIFESNAYNYLKNLKAAGYTVVSTVGRFTVQKGLHNMMRAAAMAISKNPKLIFLFAGDGEERNELINMAADLGISKNVIFTGFIRGKRLRDIYSVSDIFVMSSISEPFGLTALEAAHHGDVLILTKQSGVSEIIWSAMKYDFWDEQKLADEILAISSNPALKETLRRNVAKEYRKISWNQVAKKCLKIYNKAMKHKENR
ncbi:MAG: glycosyltransferase family 4 protein [Candidatus Saccharimonadaceae bacterium]|nr:glycosyltransferase family 4 protein [Candidatus Saccharimonadaceae bacterium]